MLQADFSIDWEPAVATVPTITEIGARVVKDRKDRISFLKEHAGVAVFDAKLEDLLPKPTMGICSPTKSATT